MWRSQRLMYGNNIKDWETRRSEVSSKRRKTFNDYNRDSLKTKNKINSRGVKKLQTQEQFIKLLIQLMEKYMLDKQQKQLNNVS